jgi:hypothetical protein
MSLVLPRIGDIVMAIKRNYRFGRTERDRLKQAGKDEKLKLQEERTALRRDSSRKSSTDAT